MTIEKTLDVASVRCPGPSVQDIVAKSGEAPPFPLNLRSNPDLGQDDVPFARYTSAEFFKAESDKLWNRTWQWVCREEHIPEVGDYVTYDVTRYSLIIMRTAVDRIQAFHNACLHRGTKLRPSFSEGSANDLRCSFHGWCWNIDGSLKEIPCRWDFPHVKDEKYQLPEANVETWGGFVFANMDPSPPPLEEYLGVLTDHFENWSMDDRCVVMHLAKELPCNWKLAQEAFLESYHVRETHPHVLVSSGDANSQYDVFGDHITRMYTALGTPSPHLTEPVTEQEIVDGMLMGDRRLMDPELLKVKDGQTARGLLAGFLRGQIEQATETDLSRYSDTEVIDNIQYHVFPNMVIQPGISLPMVYRFRPLGMDPSKSLFEMLFLRPIPEGSEAPEPAEPFRLGVEDSYTTAPGIDPDFGHIYDQDTNNLRFQQEGCMVSAKRGETLGLYQESRIRHFHQVIDRYLAG